MQGYDERFQAQNEQLQQYQDSMKQMLGIEEELSPQDAALHYQENYEQQQFQILFFRQLIRMEYHLRA